MPTRGSRCCCHHFLAARWCLLPPATSTSSLREQPSSGGPVLPQESTARRWSLTHADRNVGAGSDQLFQQALTSFPAGSVSDALLGPYCTGSKVALRKLNLRKQALMVAHHQAPASNARRALKAPFSADLP